MWWQSMIVFASAAYDSQRMQSIEVFLFAIVAFRNQKKVELEEKASLFD